MSQPLTLQEVAARLDVHYMTAYKYVRTGRLAANKVRSIWQVEQSDLDDFRFGSSTAPESDPTDRVARLHDRLIAGDDLGSWSIVQNALASGMTAEQVHLNLLGPALIQVGEGWLSGELDVADEHLASTTTIRLLGRMAPLVAQRGRSKGTVILAGAPGDQHALPTALLSDLLRMRQFAVVDLGANTPSASLLKMVRRHDDLVAIGLCVSSEQARANLDRCIDDLRSADSTAPIFVGGSALKPTDAQSADYVTVSGVDACDFVDRSLAQHKLASLGD